MSRIRLALALAAAFCVVTPVVYSQPGLAQTPELLRDEAETVYRGNLARRQNGQPPLRWNLQLTRAARWFVWDKGCAPSKARTSAPPTFIRTSASRSPSLTRATPS